ncbi:Ran-binding-domain-containing protein [Plenodomus tracheiphilus IPT5]|uniref:Ran-binding-domain-containing protein n=1 Tax=Plenodomus tracheiphilus IPT5 TaxID=1408161 RepID=A0A6A7AW56_9PLEO|nr:Ran-binding-domain-containing protein [Plenodomus tracheiphilus IPT5]
MEAILAKVTSQAVSYAIRSGIAITGSYALKQCGRLMKTVDGKEKGELAKLQMRLDSKIKIISPAIDMIELIAARGNTSLESAVGLTKSLRMEIQTLGTCVEKAVAEEQLARRGSSRAKSREENDMELKIIISDMKSLLDKIEDAVPLINLAITTSGVSLSTTLPATISPSRLLQASSYLATGDTQYSSTYPRAQQIGPTFVLSMYMLFSGHANRPKGEGFRDTTWKEVMHKARVTLRRVPVDNVYDYPTRFGSDIQPGHESHHRHIPSDSKAQEFAYQLLIVEDLDDGRVHSFEDDEPQPEPYDGIEQAGVREVFPIHEVSKIFYADTGKILNIGTEGATNNPVLLLKRDVNATPPRRMMDQNAVETNYDSDESHTVGEEESDLEQSELDGQFHRESTPSLQDTTPPSPPPPEPETHASPWQLPPTLDLEWMAFEVYTEEASTDSEIDETEDFEAEVASSSPPQASTQHSGSNSPGLSHRLSDLNLNSSTSSSPPFSTQSTDLIPSPQKSAPTPIYTAPPAPTCLPGGSKPSLSLLEMLIRLTSLQQFQQSSHLAISDEFLNFFLSDSSTVGAGGDADLRRKVRREARMRVGFDPYDESPIKRRGEDYLEHELHDGVAGAQESYEATSPEGRGNYDYDGYPSAAASPSYSRANSTSRPGTPSIASSTPMSGQRAKSSANVMRGGRQSLASVSSPSPLLRRATTQPGGLAGLKQPIFSRPPTAPHTSSSPRQGAQAGPGPVAQSFGGSVTPDTPPSSVARPQ